MEVTKAEGVLREVTGDVQQAAGELLGDTGTQLRGKARELGGKAQKVYADLGSIVRQSTAERPLMALGIAVAAGFVLGMLRTASRNATGNGRADWRSRD